MCSLIGGFGMPLGFQLTKPSFVSKWDNKFTLLVNPLCSAGNACAHCIERDNRKQERAASDHPIVGII